jgi:arylsulfatase
MKISSKNDCEHGGLEGGYGIYLRDGKTIFSYNFLGTERFSFASKTPLAKGKHTLVVDFIYDGNGIGKGGTISITDNGTKIGGGRLEKTVPAQISLGEGLTSEWMLALPLISRTNCLSLLQARLKR